MGLRKVFGASIEEGLVIEFKKSDLKKIKMHSNEMI